MERIKYLRNNGIMGIGSGFLLMICLAENLTHFGDFLPFMLPIAGLMLFVGLRDIVASCVLKDEEEDKIEVKY